MKHLFLTTCLLCPSLAFAQSAFDEARSNLTGWGLMSAVGAVEQNGNTYLVQDLTLYPSSQARLWEVVFPRAEVRLEAGTMRIVPAQDFSFALLPAGYVVPLIFSVGYENAVLQSRISETDSVSLTISADDLVLSPQGGFFESFGAQGDVSISDVSLSISEFDQHSQRTDFEFGSIIGDVLHQMGEDVVRTRIDVGAFEAGLIQTHAGLLESFDWIAAIGAGMGVEGEGSLEESIITQTLNEDEAPSATYATDGVEMRISQDENRTSASMSSSRLSAQTLSWPVEFLEMRDLDLSANFPLFGEPTERSAEFEAQGSGAYQYRGNDILPFALDAQLDVDVIPVIDLYDFNLVTGEGHWRNVTTAFDIRSFSTSSSTLSLGKGKVEASFDVEETQSGPRPGVWRAPQGRAVIEASSISDIVNFVETLPIHISRKAAFRFFTQNVFQGEEGGTANFEFTPSDVVLNGRSLN